MKKLKLTTKILIFGVLLTVIFTNILGIYFDAFLKDNYYNLAKEKIVHAKERVKSDFKDSAENLKKGLGFIDNDIGLIASVELINNYEDKDDYNSFLFDEEKKEIAKSLLSKVKISFNSEIIIYGSNEELIAYVFKDKDRYKLNFISYENSKTVLYSKYEDEDIYKKSNYIENSNIPFSHNEYHANLELDKKTIISYHFKNNAIHIMSHKSIFDKNDINKTVLHIEMLKTYSSLDFKTMSKDFKLNIDISEDKKYKEQSVPLFDTQTIENKNIYDIGDNYFSSFSIKTKVEDIYILFWLDKTFLNTLLDKNRIQLVVFLLIAIILIVIIFNFLMQLGIKTPLNNLMKQISKIKKADYSESKVVKTGDELEEISKSINELAFTVKAREESIKESQKKLNYLSTHDDLTGLLNRRSFFTKLDYALKSAKRNGKKLAVLFLDMDQFKQINDTMGHTVGDKLLSLVSHRLESTLRDSDVLARVGGDEFNIFIGDFKNIGEVQILAKKIIDEIALPFVFDDNEISSSISIGISIFPDDGLETETLIQNADLAMYESKEIGRNSYSFYASKFSEQMQQRTDIISALKSAIKNQKEFMLYYQPKVSIKTKKVIGAEALIRWNSSHLGFVTPDKFIKIAEDTHLIIDIGKWIINQACKDFMWLKEKSIVLSQISINISGVQLEYSDLLSILKDAISNSGILASEIELEVTESYLATKEERAIKILSKFREMGIELAIDDFGTGYSSLSHLQKFPVSRLKIDKAFVDDLPESSDSVAVVKAILSLAQTFNLKITVEGVESQKQLEFFEDKYCNDIQGYIYSKPLPLKEFKEFCLTH